MKTTSTTLGTMLSFAGAAAVALAIPAPAQVRPAAPPARPAAFLKCAACHNVAKGGPNGIGPNLYGVVGRKAGAVATYTYSASLKNSGVTWDRRTLDRYIANPKTIAPAGKMPAVATTPADRQAIIAYLSGLK